MKCEVHVVIHNAVGLTDAECGVNVYDAERRDLNGVSWPNNPDKCLLVQCSDQK